MFDASSPSEAAAETLTGVSVHGKAQVKFTGRDGVTGLQRLFHTDPLKILFPTFVPGDIPLAAVATTSGGLVGGDWLELELSVSEGASAQFMPQAAEKVYRSTGADSLITVDIDVGTDCWLEWLPQETIIFDRGRLRRRTRLDVAGNGRAFAGEMLVFGRTASGEQLTTGLVRDSWEIRRDGCLVWADSFHMEDDLAAVIAHPACLNGAVAMATAVLVADDAADRLKPARALLGEPIKGIRCGITEVNGILVTRWLAEDAQALRKHFGKYWAEFRHLAAGLPAALPRLWHV